MWTEQTVETLRKLALEGRSAAWIAAAIGAPSRSAVIGKANRIGVKLNGAPCRGAAGRPRYRSSARQSAWARPRPPEGDALFDRPTAEPTWERAPSRPRSRTPTVRHERRRRGWLYGDAEVGEMRRIGLVDIGEAQCRWPIGDALDEDFAFCGLQVARGRAYCAGHCRMVYRSPNA
ncbi:MAG TPA: GcrA family cell cycle regulator [Roseiarcus sp.]|nr:GcrA family cell cycle regulator [Roseiarcus sp.]